MKKIYCILINLLLAVCMCSGVLWADETSTTTSVYELDTVVVTATKSEHVVMDVPSSVAVITSEQIEQAGAANMAELFRDIPGVEMLLNSAPASQRVIIRGESAFRTLVLIDGQKISENKSMDGAPMLIEPDMIERIEIVKGPASVLYGSEAIGGVINVITKKAGEEPFQGMLSGTYDSSTDGWKSTASVFGSQGGFGYRFAGTFSDQGDRDTPAGTLDNSSYEVQDFLAYVDYSWNNSKVGLSYDSYEGDINTHTPEGTLTGPMTRFQLDLPEWSRDKFSAFFELSDLNDTVVKIRTDAYYQKTFKEFHQDMQIKQQMGPSFVTMDMAMMTENDQSTTGAEIQMDLTPFDNHYMITGFNYGNDDLDADYHNEITMIPAMGPPSAPDEFNYQADMQTYALYLQDEWDFHEDFTLTAGVRQTWVTSELSDSDNPKLNEEDASDSHPVVSVGLTYAGSENLTLRGLFSQGYNFPNLQQLFIGTVHGGTLPTLPNADLDPETSNNIEAGARFDNETIYFDIGAFMTWSEDYITTQLVQNDTAFQYSNIDKAQTHGLELASGYRIEQYHLTPYATLSWMRSKFESGDFSTWETGHPDFKGRIGLRYEKELEDQNLSLFTDLYGRFATEADREYEDGNKESYDSWATANLSFGAYLGAERQYRLDLQLNNLFDEEYTMATGNLPEAGFHVVAKASVTF